MRKLTRKEKRLRYKKWNELHPLVAIRFKNPEELSQIKARAKAYGYTLRQLLLRQLELEHLNTLSKQKQEDYIKLKEKVSELEGKKLELNRDYEELTKKFCMAKKYLEKEEIKLSKVEELEYSLRDYLMVIGDILVVLHEPMNLLRNEGGKELTEFLDWVNSKLAKQNLRIQDEIYSRARQLENSPIFQRFIIQSLAGRAQKILSIYDELIPEECKERVRRAELKAKETVEKIFPRGKI